MPTTVRPMFPYRDNSTGKISTERVSLQAECATSTGSPDIPSGPEQGIGHLQRGADDGIPRWPAQDDGSREQRGLPLLFSRYSAASRLGTAVRDGCIAATISLACLSVSGFCGSALTMAQPLFAPPPPSAISTALIVRGGIW